MFVKDYVKLKKLFYKMRKIGSNTNIPFSESNKIE